MHHSQMHHPCHALSSIFNVTGLLLIKLQSCSINGGPKKSDLKFFLQ